MIERSNIVVIGAGIVGVQLARALQREGFNVTLVDKQEAGRATSFGNAGFIASDEIFPLAHGRVLKSIPRLLTDPLGPLAINWQQIPRLMPWVYQFAKACSGKSAKRNVDTLAGLQKYAASAWREILVDEGITALMQENGAYKIFETQKGFDETAWERSEQSRYGIDWQEKSARDLGEHIPELAQSVYAGVFYPDGMHTINPFDLTQAIFSRFIADGGKFIQTEVRRLIAKNSAVTGIECAEKGFDFDRVIVAGGHLSGALLEPLGYRVPLAAERGYHLEVSHDEVSIDAPIGFHERGFYVTPMTTGLRLAGTSEFTAADSDPKPRWQRAEILRRHFDELFPDIARKETHRWMGRRPSLPDFLPVMGRAPNMSGLYFAFGHQHLGLTLSAITAKLMCQVMLGQTAAVDLEPFSLSRFQ